MSWWDVADDVGGAVVSGLANQARHIPIVGSALSAQQGLLHGGQAIYDGVTGDRDGAINHGTQALYNLANAHPAVNAATTVGDSILGAASVADHAMSAGTGQEAMGVPGNLGELGGQVAVGATRAIFGEDDSNWIAEGDAPTGTRRGELMSGYAAANPLPTTILEGAGYGALRAELEGNPDGPTSGVGSNDRLSRATEDLLGGGNSTRR